jgi:hypothetical protein
LILDLFRNRLNLRLRALGKRSDEAEATEAFKAVTAPVRVDVDVAESFFETATLGSSNVLVLSALGTKGSFRFFGVFFLNRHSAAPYGRLDTLNGD